jgi:16S rRNA (cytosine967-C5)-methyltransferase
MSISPARTTAFDILLQVEKEDAYASELLHSGQYAALSPEDHGLATQIVMGVLRWRSQLDSALGLFSKWPLAKFDAEVLTALRMGAYQLTRLERVPAHAAVHESVELVKRSRRTSAAGLVNALLRKVDGTPRVSRSSRDQMVKDQAVSDRANNEMADEARANTPAAIAARYAHPEWLVARWLAHFGLEATRMICTENQRVPATHIRLRDASGTDNSAPFDFVGENIRLSPGSLLASARRVESGDITKTQAFRNGRIAIQDEASQLVALLLGQGTRILDACAAPGGKTAILAERNPTATIVALDLHPHRTRLLRERVQAPNVNVVTADLRAFPLGEKFDRVLVDAPCTGTGTLAHHPEIKWRLRAEDIPELQSLQVSLLQAAMQHVAPGGTLLYSTCSLEPEECEQVVGKALQEKSTTGQEFGLGSIIEELSHLQNNKILTTPNIERLTQGPYLRTYSGVHPCDGFFAALLHKL